MLAMGLAGSLQPEEVHIWQIEPGNAAWNVSPAILSADEREKAERYRTPQLQKNYSRCRSALRLILGLYAGQPAASLHFRYGQFGKPELPGRDLHFNLSHSGDHALIAISSHMVGVDLEFIGSTNICDAGLTDLVCHPREKTALAQLPEPEKSAAFYRLWTQKEAYCKMLGVGIGLQQSLNALQFSATASPSVFQVCANECGQPPAFFVHELNLWDGYAASVCLPFVDARIGLFKA